MAKYRYFKCSFWLDEWVSELPIAEKMTYAYLFTNEHTNMAGIYPLSLKTLCFETGLERGEAAQVIDFFQKAGKIVYREGYVWVKNFLRHQPNTGKKILIGVAGDLSEVSAPQLVREFLEHYKELPIPYPYPMDNPSISHPYPMDNPSLPVDNSTNVDNSVDNPPCTPPSTVQYNTKQYRDMHIPSITHPYPMDNLSEQQVGGLVSKEEQNEQQHPGGKSARYKSTPDPDRPLFSQIQEWWEHKTWIPTAGRGKLLASTSKSKEEFKALRDRIEELANAMGVKQMIQEADNDYDNKPPDKKPATLSYYVPMWERIAAGREDKVAPIRIDVPADVAEAARRQKEKVKQEQMGDIAKPEEIQKYLGEALSSLVSLTDSPQELRSDPKPHPESG